MAACGAVPTNGPTMGFSASFWRLEENKIFEVALAKHFADADRFERIAAYLPNKTSQDVQRRYRQLEDDLRRIEDGGLQASGLLPGLPTPTSSCSPSNSSGESPSKKAKVDVPVNGDRRKGVPWTEEEHRLFLLGLAKFGKGDWRSIARNFVVSRTPTQVASHAQKYFIRLNSLNKKDKRRASIHDITSPTAVPPAAVPAAATTVAQQPVAATAPPPSLMAPGASIFPLQMSMPAGPITIPGPAATAYMVAV